VIPRSNIPGRVVTHDPNLRGLSTVALTESSGVGGSEHDVIEGAKDLRFLRVPPWQSHSSYSEVGSVLARK
jgi:hypothetical protein